ncbi:MAG: asparagine synthetase B, partial [Anaerolineae bacterium]|nr:asparagine synthetase B [Anaerolineae bacterium]
MSGIAGIIRLDGASIDQTVVAAMMSGLARCGPDDQSVWVADNVALLHAALHTTPESPNAHQPLTLNGRYWISADARIDNRDELQRLLSIRGVDLAPGATDAEYIICC